MAERAGFEYYSLLPAFYLSDLQGEKSITEILPFFLQGIGVFRQFLAVIRILEFLQKASKSFIHRT